MSIAVGRVGGCKVTMTTLRHSIRAEAKSPKYGPILFRLILG